jgi:Lsr2
MAELSALPRAAVVVEDRYSQVFKLPHADGGRAAEQLAEACARFPSVPVMFAETRPLAQEWTYRFLGAALAELSAHAASAGLEATIAPGPAGGPAPAPPTPAELRTWAADNGWVVSERGRVPAAVRAAYEGR